MTSPGKVVLVGAGPGDPGLITVAGREYLALADVVVYDRLVSLSLLKEARADAELIFAGKEGGGRRVDQDTINSILVERARQGKLVVRLKGGDPFVFGRGAEEASVLRQAAIPFTVVPGVTSAIAAPAYAGIPITDRRLASSFAVITGHEDDGKLSPSLDWAKLSTGVDTLIVLMGTRALLDIVEKLTMNGRPLATPAAVIRWGTTPEQRTVVGTLADIAQQARAEGIEPPALLVVGEVVGLRAELAWFEQGPLFGRRVLVTRSRSRASALVRLLAQEGAIPVELPAIEIEPCFDPAAVSAAIGRLRGGGYAWGVFTSSAAVEIFFRLLGEAAADARVFASARVAAIGPATAAELRNHGLMADVVPDEFIAEGVLTALQGQVNPGDSVLLPRAEGARRELVTGLQGMGAQVDEVTLYRAARPGKPAVEALDALKAGKIDTVTFTSSSTVRNLLRLLGGDTSALAGCAIACIGPVTAEAARRAGMGVDIIAKEYTVPGLVAALRQTAAVQTGG